LHRKVSVPLDSFLVGLNFKPKRLAEALEFKSRKDDLTGLSNRVEFYLQVKANHVVFRLSAQRSDLAAGRPWKTTPTLPTAQTEAGARRPQRIDVSSCICVFTEAPDTKWQAGKEKCP
jgi:hypothetical protein